MTNGLYEDAVVMSLTNTCPKYISYGILSDFKLLTEKCKISIKVY